MSRRRRYSEQEFKNAVSSSRSIREILRKIDLQPTGGNYKSIYSYASELNVDLSHLLGQGWSAGEGNPFAPKKDLNEILVKNRPTNSNNLRKRLLKEKIFEHKCSMCMLSTWLDNEIPLELDHINGINDDNRIENLRVLCPNCHALTPTYRGKNHYKQPPVAQLA
jgi:hypothetical protein